MSDQKKRKSQEFIDDSSDSGSDAEVKKVKKEKKSEKRKQTHDSDSEDDPKSGWELGKSRKVSINEFKGRMLIDIREYYTDQAGDLKPGRKGISLTREQWEKLTSLTDKINNALK